MFLTKRPGSNEQPTSERSGDDGANDSPSSQEHPHDPDPQEIQTVRSLRAEAIYALDSIFQNIDSELGPHLREIRHVVSTLPRWSLRTSNGDGFSHPNASI